MLVDWVGSVTVFILLANSFNYTFNLFINEIVREPIIDEGLGYVFYFFMKYYFGGGDYIYTYATAVSLGGFCPHIIKTIQLHLLFQMLF